MRKLNLFLFITIVVTTLSCFKKMASSIPIAVIGLEKCYFERINTSDLKDSSNDQAILLNFDTLNIFPQKIKNNYKTRKDIEDEHGRVNTIQDYEVTSNNSENKIIIRQLVEEYNIRAKITYWVFYINEKRESAWFYNPLQMESGISYSRANITIDTVTNLGDSLIIVKIRGTQFRRSIWLMRSSSLYFNFINDSLIYKYKINNFCFMKGDSFEIHTEVDSGDEIIKKTVYNPSATILNKYGYIDPNIAEDLSWSDYASIANKITSDEIAEKTIIEKDDRFIGKKVQSNQNIGSK